MPVQQENISAIIVLIVGVGIGVLSLIFVGVLGGQVYQSTEADIDSLVQTVSNDSFTTLNGTNVSLSNDDILSGTLTITNTSGFQILLANFTIHYGDGQVLLLNNSWNNTAMYASYQHGDYVTRDYIKDSIVSAFSALNTTGSYLPIVVLAVIIFVVLSIVMGLGSFGGMNRTYGGAL